MPVEEIIERIEAQRRTIMDALREQKSLLDILKNSDKESYEWITPLKAAELVGVSPSTIYWKINHGDLAVKHIKQ